MSDLIAQGLVIAVIGYMIVFIALVILTSVFLNIPKLIKLNLRKKLRERGKKECCDDSELMLQGDVSAAIALALSLHFGEIHDEQSTVLTIKKVSRTYSPWSSKIYGLRNFHRP
jgi:glutaconyl-CoA/methylmalonyl-CoA decarboxylase subunit delta